MSPKSSVLFYISQSQVPKGRGIFVVCTLNLLSEKLPGKLKILKKLPQNINFFKLDINKINLFGCIY